MDGERMRLRPSWISGFLFLTVMLHAGTAAAEWSSDVVITDTITPQTVAVTHLPIGMPVLTWSQPAAGAARLDCFLIDPASTPITYTHTPVQVAGSVVLSRHLARARGELHASLVTLNGLEILRASEDSPCDWGTVVITDTVVAYTRTDITAWGDELAVIGYDVSQGVIDVYTETQNGQLALAYSVEGSNGISGIVSPAVSFGPDGVCLLYAGLNAQGAVSGYFTECQGIGSENPVESPIVNARPLQAPDALYRDGAHYFLYHNAAGGTIGLAQLVGGVPVTVTLGAAPLGNDPFGLALAEGTAPGSLRAIWPGEDMRITTTQVITSTLVASFPSSFKGSLALQPINAAGIFTVTHVAVGAGSLLFTSFTPGAIPVLSADRLGILAVALLLAVLSGIALRRNRTL